MGLLSLQLGDFQESSPTPQFESISSSVLSFMVQLSHPYTTPGKTIALTRWTFVSKIMSPFFNMLSSLVTAFHLRRKLRSHQLWFWSPPKWSLSLFPLFPHLFAMKWWDWMPWSWFSECWALSQLFHSPLSLSSRSFLCVSLPCIVSHLSCHSSFVPSILCRESTPEVPVVWWSVPFSGHNQQNSDMPDCTVPPMNFKGD